MVSHEAWLVFKAALEERAARGEVRLTLGHEIEPPIPKRNVCNSCGLSESCEYCRKWAHRLQVRLSHLVTGKRDAEECERVFGYSREQCRAHLERQFVRGMSWDNYAGNLPPDAKRVWHIDHIIPKLAFSVGDMTCFALSNLRPLWRKENFRKGNRRLHLI